MARKIRRRKRSYRQFIEGKITVAERVGFEVDPDTGEILDSVPMPGESGIAQCC